MSSIGDFKCQKETLDSMGPAACAQIIFFLSLNMQISDSVVVEGVVIV